ncbi:hypothetical protein [Thermocladium modestius]|uniref:hypothetical protein n=1 Tax=Thermocladium modestius TaxID=62609 RepID=UPI0016676AE1|nr:hypothetical protein [Thermocladium modestius]
MGQVKGGLKPIAKHHNNKERSESLALKGASLSNPPPPIPAAWPALRKKPSAEAGQ